jgi:hypothetical protein
MLDETVEVPGKPIHIVRRLTTHGTHELSTKHFFLVSTSV